MAEDYRIARLAKQIGDEVKKDHHLLLTEIEILNLRRQGAGQLYSICAGFVASINRLLAPPVVELVPPEYAPEMFRETGVNVIQLNAKGLIIQITFESTRDKFSTEKFLTPYILEGEVLAYNREMLDQSQVRTQALFYCLEDERNTWHYYEWLHGRTGNFGRDELVSLLERLV
jgi:hypothetical protein